MKNLRDPPGTLPKYVLILDDDANLSKVLGMAIEDHGLFSVVLSNADAGLEWINAHPGQLALLLTDISMPGAIDGAELACQIAKRLPKIPIIIMSGGSWSRDFPAYCFFDKPFDLRSLMIVINEALGLPH